MTRKPHSPGRSDRQGMTLVELLQKFPDDATAEAWFETWVWPNGPVCPDCGNMDVAEAKHPTMPYRCPECKKYFSVKKATVMRSSNLGYQKWALAIYLFATNIKGISSMKLHRDLGIRQATAWHMLHRIREAFNTGVLPLLGDIEVDETYIGGKERNKHKAKKAKTQVEAMAKKAIVIGAKARGSGRIQAAVIESATAYQLRGFVREVLSERGQLFTDDHRGYQKLPRRKVVNHSRGQYVHGEAHTQGIESFWSMLKRGYIGTYHTWSWRHLHRYVNEFSGRHNLRDKDTSDQMGCIAAAMAGRRLRYADLVG